MSVQVPLQSVRPGWQAAMQVVRLQEGVSSDELAPHLREAVEGEIPPTCRQPVRFALSAEISSIYKKGDRTRKVHNLVLMPDFGAVEALNHRLAAIGSDTIKPMVMG